MSQLGKRPMFFMAVLLPAAALVLSMTACDRDEAPADRTTQTSPSGETIAAPGVANGALTFTRDPENGSLQLAAEAPYQGEWEFADVTSSYSERAMGGTTTEILTIESHQVPPGVHLSFRLSHPGGEIDAGRYSIDGAQDGRALDARWEYMSQHFRSISPAKGTVTISSITEDRVAGTYDVTLTPMTETGEAAELTGSFDIKIQR